MNTAAPRAELRPFEEVIIASTLESAAGQEALMETIHGLSLERGELQARLARHPWSDREAAARIQKITMELESCWAEVRRRRAAQRVRMEEALGVDPVACQPPEQQASEQVRQTQREQLKKPRRLPLTCAS